MAKGSIGANCSTIIHRRQKSVPCSCPKCSNYRVIDGIKYCMGSGDILRHCKTTCQYYSGPPIYRKKSKRTLKHTKTSKPRNTSKKSGMTKKK